MESSNFDLGQQNNSVFSSAVNPDIDQNTDIELAILEVVVTACVDWIPIQMLNRLMTWRTYTVIRYGYKWLLLNIFKKGNIHSNYVLSW